MYSKNVQTNTFAIIISIICSKISAVQILEKTACGMPVLYKAPGEAHFLFPSLLPTLCQEVLSSWSGFGRVIRVICVIWIVSFP